MRARKKQIYQFEDRGFQLGDGVYEVLRTYQGQLFALEEHLERLFRSLDAIQLAHRFTPAELTSLIREGIQRAGFPESLVYLQITRGAAPRANEFPRVVGPTVVLTVRALEPPAPALREGGVRKLRAAGRIAPGKSVILMLTGAALKDLAARKLQQFKVCESNLSTIRQDLEKAAWQGEHSMR
jgi:branched-subunit amino acid aminotransferase/4-amino-4-deoxychorismate lyase